jgi:carbon-monoxide dehydrogenase medium subunit
MGLLTTDIGSDEMLVEIAYPAPKPHTGTCFQEVARRRGDFALAGVAAMVTLDQDRRCTEVRIALCGVGETPVDASEAVAGLIEQSCTDKAITAAAAEVQDMIEPSGNVHATADYQRHIAGVLTRRTLTTALQRAGHVV